MQCDRRDQQGEGLLVCDRGPPRVPVPAVSNQTGRRSAPASRDECDLKHTLASVRKHGRHADHSARTGEPWLRHRRQGSLWRGERDIDDEDASLAGHIPDTNLAVVRPDCLPSDRESQAEP